MTSDQTGQDYTAIINTYTLTTNVNPSGSGSVTKNPDNTSYTHGENVTLTASANTSYALFRWTGDVPLGHENDNPLSITMDSDKTLTAHFKTYTISGTVKSTEGISEVTITFSNEGGTVVTDPNGNYSHQVFYGWTGTATPSKAGYTFFPSSRSYTNVTSDQTTQDYTDILNTYTLTTQVNTSVGGFITKNPDKALYNHGESVELIAHTNTGYTFSEWTGDVLSGHENDSPLTIIMDSDKSITANFSAITEENGKKNGCFIATAAYGSPLHYYVRILQKFRDKYLIPSKLGSKLVSFYYKYSPFVADFITKHRVLKVAVRISLMPLVAFSYSILHFGPIMTVIILVFIFLLPIPPILFCLRRMIQLEAKFPKALASFFL